MPVPRAFCTVPGLRLHNGAHVRSLSIMPTAAPRTHPPTAYRIFRGQRVQSTHQPAPWPETPMNPLSLTILQLLGAATALLVLLAFVRHASHAFFLFDDFALVALASDHGFLDFVGGPYIGFYRPAGFWVLRGLWLLFGWSHPVGYVLASVGLHVANAALVFLLARGIEYGRTGAGLAAIAFIAYAPAAEAVFWTSAVFDRVATLGLLLGLYSVVVAGRASSKRMAMIGILGSLAGVSLAILAKETGFVMPAVVVIQTFLLLRASVAKAAGLIACCASAAGLLLFLRSLEMPVLEGAYGNWMTLVGNAPLARNLWSGLMAAVHPPLPRYDLQVLALPAVNASGWLVAVCWGLAWFTAALSNWRLVLTWSLSWALLFVPVVWTTLIPGSSAAGRFLYAPGVCAALILAYALAESDLRRSRLRLITLIGRVAGAVVLSMSAVSIGYQAAIWSDAAKISNSSVQQLRQFENYAGTVYITNLPFWYEQGPYVIKDYAFRQYYGSKYRALVRGRAMTLTYEGGQSRFAGWVAADVAPVSAPTPEDRIVTLQLPLKVVQPQPASMITQAMSHGGAKAFLSGWAIDGAASQGCGVDFVHLYFRMIAPVPREQEFIARVTVAEEAPALSSWPRQFRSCGWSATISLPAAGKYELIAYPHDLVVGDFSHAATSTVDLR